jgi:alpha-2-macroglobulin
LTVDVEYQSKKTVIPGYPNFEFDSPIRRINSDKNTLFDDDLDVNGFASFKQETSSLSQASGMLNAIYTMRVFEQGGNFSIDRFSQNYSPYKQYVGFRTPDLEADNSLVSGKKHSFDVVLVNEQGQLLKKPSKVRVKIYRMEWRWWYETGDDDLGNFMARNGNMLVYDTLLNHSSGKTAFKFGLKEQDFGRFLITVTDEEGFHQSGKIVSIDVPYWSRGNQKNNEYASMLNFSTDKKSYVKGELVKLSIPSPAIGKALISIETRTKIVKKFWINTVKGETTCSFETTQDMAPNAYVHVSLIQPHSATTNDLPIRMYGIVPISVDDPATHLHPQISVAKEWRPESTAKVTVKEEFGKGMTYTLAIVDEGLLDLTRFSTPNPWNTFYAKEALGIKTWDMYNSVIGAYSGKLNRLLSIGGDGSADDGAGPKANRFKPMVYFLGPFVLPAGSSKTHQIELPTYIGSVRVMVVAHSAMAFGNAEETVTIKKPLMVLGTLPRVIGPSETIQLPVDVFAMKDNIKNVDVQVTCNDLLVVNGAKNQGIKFAAEGDQIVNFELKVANKLGIAKIKIFAKSGNETATQEFEVDVRSPNPQVVESETKVIEPGSSVSFAMEQDGISGSHSYSLEASQFTSINLSGRMSELINYPHGCIEQTTSAVFPQLFAMDIMQFNEKDKSKMTSNIRAAITKYQSFQQYEGGFAYWPGDREASDWGSNYAGHFIIEAEQHGFTLPTNLKSRWIEYQKNQANNWSSDSYSSYSSHAEESNQLIQAYRLYTLALAGKPELGAMNRLKENSKLGTTAKWRLAAAYYLAGQKDLAKQMTRNLSFTSVSYREYSYSYGSTLRDKAMNLEAGLLIESKSTDQLEKEIADVLKSNQWLSTQEAGYCILSLTSGKIKNGGALQFEVNTEKVTANKCMTTKNYTEADGSKMKRLSIKNTSSKKIYLTFCTTKVPQIGKEKHIRSNLDMDISYTNLKGVKIDPSKMMQGTDFIMEVKLKNPTKNEFYREMALSQIMPSGWEIHNARLYDEESTPNIDYQDYRDDRVYSYFKLAPNESKVFKIQLNASYLGRFYLPAVFSEAMYDHSVNAQEKGRWVEVTKIVKQPKSS